MTQHTQQGSSLTTRLMNWADRHNGRRTLFSNLMHSSARLILIIYAEFKNNDLSLRSGALTYTVLLSLVPVLAMSTAVVKGLGGSDQLREVAFTYIETFEQAETASETVTTPTAAEQASSEPASNLTSHLREALGKLFDYVDKTNFATLGTFGVMGLFLTVVLVLGNIELAMNSIWHVEAGRSIIRKIADYLTLLVLMPISINVAFAASAFLKNPTLASKFELFIPFLWMQTLILKMVPVFFIALTFYVMYIFFPNTRVRTIPALLGATLAAILWFGVQNIYISLQIGVARYNAIYGSFATLPLFLVWVYLGWLFILGGALVAYAFQHLHSYRLTPASNCPSLRLSGAVDIMEQVQKAYAERRSITEDDLNNSLTSYEDHIIGEIVAELTKARAILISGETHLLLPAAPPDKLSSQEIIKIMLGAETPDTMGGKLSEKVLQAARQGIGAETSQSASLSSRTPRGGSGQEGPSST